MKEEDSNKPIILNIDYPDRELNRLTTFFRLIVAIPILIILGALSGAPFVWEQGPWQLEWASAHALVVGPTVLMIVFRRKYPRWWFDWNLNLSRFGVRVFSFMALLTDVYPSTDDEQGVHLQINYPDVEKDLNRWMPRIKWFLAIPHYILLFFINTAALMVVIIVWFAILFTGRYPKNLFDFVVSVFRWNLRVLAYVALLVTDKYPPFNFSGWAAEESDKKES